MALGASWGRTKDITEMIDPCLTLSNSTDRNGLCLCFPVWQPLATYSFWTFERGTTIEGWDLNFCLILINLDLNVYSHPWPVATAGSFIFHAPFMGTEKGYGREVSLAQDSQCLYVIGEWGAWTGMWRKQGAWCLSVRMRNHVISSFFSRFLIRWPTIFR